MQNSPNSLKNQSVGSSQTGDIKIQEMAVRRKKLKKMENENQEGQMHLDRISILPDNVISKILVRLPIKEAVATSRLSPTWRYKWISMPELVFNYPDSTICSQNFDKWINFINGVLLFHEGNITRFEIRNLLDSAAPFVHPWLMFLSRKGLTNLFIEFRSHRCYVCHSSLFSCQNLRVLDLVNCELKVPSHTKFEGFMNLVDLALIKVTANKETVEFLVNSSPLLKTLCISLSNSNASCLSISALNLTKCTIHGKFEHIAFNETPKLDFIEIRTWVNEDLGRCKLDRNLDKLLKLQEARIYYPFIECLSVDNFLERLPITYYQLKRVRLHICFEDPRQILSAIWLFRSSPSLKKIVIRSVDLENMDLLQDLCLEELYRTLSKDEDTLQSLEVFEFDYFDGLENELKLIEFVLLKASSLQTMKMNWDREKERDIERDFDALAKLMQFQRTCSGLKFIWS